MATLSYAQLEGVWLQAAQGTKYGTQEWAALMAAIAEAESGGNPASVNATDNGGTQTSWGLWQISTGTHATPSPNWNNPYVNAQLAIQKLNDQGLTAWGTYDTGAYKGFLNGATTPDTAQLTGADLSEATSAAAGAAGAGGSGTCAWQIGGPSLPVVGSVGKFCVLSNSQARALIGGTLLAAGVIVGGAGLALIAAAVGMRAAESVSKAIPGTGRVLSASRAAGGGGPRPAPAAPRSAPASATAPAAAPAGRPRARTTYTRNPGGRVQGRPRVAAGATSRRPLPARP